jgi:hypothetical protein
MGVLYFPISARVQLKQDSFNPQFVKNYTWSSFGARIDFLNVQKNSQLVQINSAMQYDNTLGEVDLNRDRIGRFQWIAQMELLDNTGEIFQASRANFVNDSTFCAWSLNRGPFINLSNDSPNFSPYCCFLGGVQFRRIQIFFDNQIDLSVSPSLGVFFSLEITFVFETQ